MSTYAGSDNCTDIILDLIAEHESNGNYNAVIGDARATADLSAMTITQIYALMDQRLAAGMPSTAIGRYQIIRRTMRALLAPLGINNDTLFTPEVQDAMAWRLLIGRGYPAWWRGSMLDVEFAHGLACEWASLPDPDNGGRSHYDDLAGNHAGTTLQHVYERLQAARYARPAPNS